MTIAISETLRSPTATTGAKIALKIFSLLNFFPISPSISSCFVTQRIISKGQKATLSRMVTSLKILIMTRSAMMIVKLRMIASLVLTTKRLSMIAFGVFELYWKF